MTEGNSWFARHWWKLGLAGLGLYAFHHAGKPKVAETKYSPDLEVSAESYQINHKMTILAKGLEAISMDLYLIKHGAAGRKPTSTQLNCHFGIFREWEKKVVADELSVIYLEGAKKGTNVSADHAVDPTALQFHDGLQRISDYRLKGAISEGVFYGTTLFQYGYYDEVDLSGWEEVELSREQADALYAKIEHMVNSDQRGFVEEIYRKHDEGELYDEDEREYLDNNAWIEEGWKRSTRRTKEAFDNSLSQFLVYAQEHPSEPRKFATLLGDGHWNDIDGFDTLGDYIKSLDQHPEVTVWECPDL